MQFYSATNEIAFFFKAMENQNKNIEVKSYQGTDGKTYYPFMITDFSLDRSNEIVDIDTLIIKDYLKNPIVNLKHNSYIFPIGTSSNIRREGDEYWGDVLFHELKDPFSQTFLGLDVEPYVKKGIVKTDSIGFRIGKTIILQLTPENTVITPNGRTIKIPLGRVDQIKNSYSGGVPFHQYGEMIEFSICSIPDNPNSLTKDYKEFNDKLNTYIKESDMDINEIINKEFKFKDGVAFLPKEIETWFEKNGLIVINKSGAALSAANKDKLDKMFTAHKECKTFNAKQNKMHDDCMKSIKAMKGEEPDGDEPDDKKKEEETEGKEIDYNLIVNKIAKEYRKEFKADMDTLYNAIKEIKPEVMSKEKKQELLNKI